MAVVVESEAGMDPDPDPGGVVVTAATADAVCEATLAASGMSDVARSCILETNPARPKGLDGVGATGWVCWAWGGGWNWGGGWGWNADWN